MKLFKIILLMLNLQPFNYCHDNGSVAFPSGPGLSTTAVVAGGRRPADGFCGIRNSTTQGGEEISYAVFYSLAGMYVHAGDATFTNQLEKLNGKNVFHLVGAGQTKESYDWLYRVRDRYESFLDTATFQTLKFSRAVEEGRERKQETVLFNRNANQAISAKKEYSVPDCIQDVLSAIYYARNLDFTDLKKGDKIPFDMFLDNEVHHLYIRYMGKEEVKTRFGKFRSIRIRPLLVKGTIFSGGENMIVWVSDDANRIPLRIESQIMIGSVKVDMSGFRNLRHPFTAAKKLK